MDDELCELLKIIGPEYADTPGADGSSEVLEKYRNCVVSEYYETIHNAYTHFLADAVRFDGRGQQGAVKTRLHPPKPSKFKCPQ